MGAARGVLASLAGLLLAAALIVAPGAATPAHASEAGTIYSLLNQARGGSGLGPLARNAALDQVALNWANQMAADGRMYHNPNYSTQIPSGWSRAAENVAQGFPTGAAMHDGWWGSPGHRANMLGDFTDVGVAFIQAGGTTWGVQVFAKYGSSVPAPAPAAPPTAPAPPPSNPAPAPAPAQAPPPPAPAPEVAPEPQPESDPEPEPEPTPEPEASPEAQADAAAAMPDKAPRPSPSAPVVDDASTGIPLSNAASLTASELPVAVGATAGMLGAGFVAAFAFAGSFRPRKGAENRRSRWRIWSRNGNGTP
ncbi:CAP domain-containing protein [Microcella sp.]|uniref:CAP domain-containing protein n=1 Tax=Microcella sp. TaxID=1913979 RepID=UPI0039191EEB